MFCFFIYYILLKIITKYIFFTSFLVVVSEITKIEKVKNRIMMSITIYQAYEVTQYIIPFVMWLIMNTLRYNTWYLYLKS